MSNRVVSRKRRIGIFLRDGYRCQKCETPVVLNAGACLHRINRRAGWQSDNIVTLCRECKASENAGVSLFDYAARFAASPST